MLGTLVNTGTILAGSVLGGILLAASGLSMLQIRDCKTLNLLPALVVPVIWFGVRALF